MKAYVPIYRKILAKACKATWFHRGLWFFGFLAGLAQTGAVTNDILRLAPMLQPGALSWANLEESWNAFTFGKTLITGLATSASSGQIIASITYVIGAAIILVLLIVISQHVLLTSVHRAAKNKAPLHWRDISRELKTLHVGRLLSIDLLSRISLLILLLGGGLLLGRLVDALPIAAGFATFAAYLVMLPIAFAISSVAMMALIHVTRENHSVGRAIHEGMAFLTTHWLATLEFAAILFVVNFFFTLILLAGVIVLSQVVVVLLAASLASATMLFTLFSLSVIVVVLFMVLIMGFMTTFNYSAWTEFIEKYLKAPAHPRTEHAVAWFRKAFIR